MEKPSSVQYLEPSNTFPSYPGYSDRLQDLALRDLQMCPKLRARHAQIDIIYIWVLFNYERRHTMTLRSKGKYV